MDLGITGSANYLVYPLMLYLLLSGDMCVYESLIIQVFLLFEWNLTYSALHTTLDAYNYNLLFVVTDKTSNY